MFTDSVTIHFFAGKGGNGIIAWRRERALPKGGPYGGNGGNGGSITLAADSQVFSLDSYRNRSFIRGENGTIGGVNNRSGRSGKELLLKVPCGTLIRDSETGALLCDLTEAGERFVLCEGGRGGKGNSFFKTATNQAPAKCTPGKLGEERRVKLELKLIADVGFLGLPNAGKSTLFSALSATPVKTGAYPFTTLKPNLSFIEFDDFSRIYLADVPGILPDAHLNRGLGLSFLKHIERCSTLIYIIDIAGQEGRDPFEDFLTLRKEVKSYSLETFNKPFLVALNKIDQVSEESLAAFKKRYPFPQESLFALSALKGSRLPPFVEQMRAMAQESGKRYY